MTKIAAEHVGRGVDRVNPLVHRRPGDNNLESQRRQYALADRARQLGSQQVEVIGEKLGKSGGGIARLLCILKIGPFLDRVFCLRFPWLDEESWHEGIEVYGRAGGVRHQAGRRGLASS